MGYPTDWGQNKLGVEIQKYLSGKTTWDKLEKSVEKSWNADRNK